MMTKVLDERTIQQTWLQFTKSKELALRNLLLEHYFPIVRYNAERIGAKLPDEVDVDDLISAGTFGLVDAILAFDLERKVKFETYCAPRIRGAILDALRGMDWVPRLVRSRAQRLDRVVRELEALLDRSPNEQEIATRMKLPSHQYEKVRRDAIAVTQVSLSRKLGNTDSGKDVHEIDLVEDRRGRNPIADIHRKDLKELVTRGLSRAERLVLTLYYYEQMTMKEIGAVLDLSESRVSQMHSSIMGRLKDQLNIRRKEFIS